MRSEAEANADYKDQIADQGAGWIHQAYYLHWHVLALSRIYARNAK